MYLFVNPIQNTAPTSAKEGNQGQGSNLGPILCMHLRAVESPIVGVQKPQLCINARLEATTYVAPCHNKLRNNHPNYIGT